MKPDPLRVVLKRAILCGYPLKVPLKRVFFANRDIGT